MGTISGKFIISSPLIPVVREVDRESVCTSKRTTQLHNAMLIVQSFLPLRNSLVVCSIVKPFNVYLDFISIHPKLLDKSDVIKSRESGAKSSKGFQRSFLLSLPPSKPFTRPCSICIAPLHQ